MLGYDDFAGSLQIDGIQFVAYSNDHPPRHVHGFIGETEVIVNLRADGDVALASRKDAIRPSGAKRSEVKKILTAAAQNFERLVALCEGIHGKA
jgi:hypothetical protein